MSEMSEMRAKYEMALARAEAAEQREKNEKFERDHYAAEAARLRGAEERAVATEKLLDAMTKTEDPLSPMAVLAKVSEERDEIRATSTEELKTARAECEAMQARVKELEAKLGETAEPMKE